MPALRPYNIFHMNSLIKNSFKSHPLLLNNINFLLNNTLKIGILLSSFTNENILEYQIANLFQKNYLLNNNTIKFYVKIFYYCSINEINLFKICNKNKQVESYTNFVSVKN